MLPRQSSIRKNINKLYYIENDQKTQSQTTADKNLKKGKAPLLSANGAFLFPIFLFLFAHSPALHLYGIQKMLLEPLPDFPKALQ